MQISKLTGAVRACLLGCALLGCAQPACAAARAEAASTAISSNWAGYVAQPSAAAAVPFTGVSGTWTVPSVTCVSARASYSAVWVGLGGYREAAGSLEQVGVDADCSRGARASYASWYELLPAAPVALALEIHPGDLLSASVTERAHRVTLRLRDLTSSERFSTTRRVRRIDLSSAEWIVEAPSECTGRGSGRCSTLALSDFGSVAFASASATAHGHTGAISDPVWSTTALELRQSPLSRAGVRARAGAQQVFATPTESAPGDGSFAVGWRAEAPPLRA